MAEQAARSRPSIVGDVVFGGPESSVAVCTLASRRLLPLLAGRPEIGIAGRVYTENVGVERMVRNLVAMPAYRYLIVCGRESRHKVGQTILALHRSGLDATGRVVGSEAPEPVLPNLTEAELDAFQARIAVVDMTGVEDAEAIVARARELMAQAAPSSDAAGAAPAVTRAAADVPVIAAVPDPPDDWTYDPLGFFLIFVDRERQAPRAEHYDQERRLLHVFEGPDARALTQTIIREGCVSLLAHAAYLGRELAKAEAALQLGLAYEQDSPLRPDRPAR